ncbi:AAA family ATPase [Fusibacter tunisiensis]|uniref:AAA15 family ATPase/GTPase n=1 Tax=Fusibacter tunisiensis TaxID=1008308 RepID=A0ABS2MNL6_9FIRM|nr:ATP-binding protein [Fusibacter tunisiensis]MBM7560912.1 AAA15 family ATPase/GTPase [Fusibacter tunisiensis]
MLIQFNFENYKSYLDEVSLDLTATSYTELKDNLIEGKKKEMYMKVVSIYGANASGKSNILEAFEHMKRLVIKSLEESNKSNKMYLKRFQFSEVGKKTPALFEVFFMHKGKEYQYGFNLNEKKILSEWLYKRNFRFKKKYELVFEREGQKYNLNKDLQKANDIIEIMNEKTLLITLLSSFEVEDIKNVFDWFVETEVINFGNVTFEYIISKSLPKVDFDNEKESNRFTEFLENIDIGIKGIRKEKTSLNGHTDNGAFEKYRIYTKHLNMDTGKLEEIPLSEESSGTIKMIGLYRFILDALQKGKTLLVDEMDAKLHPLLTRYIINLFQNSDSNPKGAQLIFTTHDTNTLSNELFRRDQIWFVEKDKRGVSELFSLAEYKIDDKKVRKDASYNKDYLGGRYGAIPNIDMKVGE